MSTMTCSKTGHGAKQHIDPRTQSYQTVLESAQGHVTSRLSYRLV